MEKQLDEEAEKAAAERAANGTGCCTTIACVKYLLNCHICSSRRRRGRSRQPQASQGRSNETCGQE